MLTKAIEKKLPALGAKDGEGYDAAAVVKFFAPWSNWTWYATEYDPAERVFFGLVVGLETELGYFSLAELESVRGPAGLKIERDLHWSPRPLKECVNS
jgi:hypothetical protein